ncbi:MAG: ATP-dependent helicase, partial [Deltaproteobacteria bacterium]|nr:ATP-dependent helicase [Deltaproteobacteria bacterium]
TAITFTNRAADEMRERLQAMPGIETGPCFIGTFHAFCLKLLRKLDSSLTVVSEEQRDRNIQRMFPAEPPGRLQEIRQGIVSSYRHQGNVAGSGNCGPEKDPGVEAYLQELRLKHGIDLDGVIPRAVSLLRADNEFLEQTRAGTRHLFIDEFQDLNADQYELVRLLGQSCSVFAIGDPDQAIYGFRGSSPEFFHRFISEFGAETVSLARNYRSAANILKAAGAVIANNHHPGTGFSANLVAEQSEPGAIELYRTVSARAEAEFVVQRIEELMGGISHFSIDSGRGGQENSGVGKSFRDFAVLYRLSQQAEALREALERRGIPFQVVNIRPFFMRRDIKPLYYWMQAATGSPPDGVATGVYLGILAAFPGIGSHTLAVLENRLPLGACPDFFTRAAAVKLPQAVLTRIRDVEEQLQVFREAAADEGIASPAGAVMDYLRLNRQSDAALRFLGLAGSFGNDLQGFAAHLRKNETATVYDEKAEAVSLMTLHGAKGLEFPVVFITGMEEGFFPGDSGKQPAGNVGATHDDARTIEEERRLFYVGMTRAQNVLVLTSAATRKIFGSYSNRPVSPFIAEIPASLYRQREQAASRKRKKSGQQMKLFS